MTGDQAAQRGGEAAFDLQIGRRAVEMGAFVLGKLAESGLKHGFLGNISDDIQPIEDMLTFWQKTNAGTAVKMLVIAALHGVTPSENFQSSAKLLADGRGEAVIGQSRLGSALSILESIDGQLEQMAAARDRVAVGGASGGGAEAIQVERVR